MNTLTILTYNIWFDISEREKRVESLIKTIRKSSADVVCLQEVVPTVHAHLVKELGAEYKYVFPAKIEAAYGCMILSKHNGEYSEYKFDSHMGRMLHTIIINFPIKKDTCSVNQPLVIATAHFESEFRKHNIIKLKQYLLTKDILNKLYEQYGPVVFCSDTNLLCTEEKYFITSDLNWEDTWKQDGSPPHKEYTYDTKTNLNLQKRNIAKEIRSRIDRIIYRGFFTLNQFSILKAGEAIVEPSDHYGVVASLVVGHDSVII